MDDPREADRKAFEEWQKRFPYGEQDAWGNDLGLLRANLRLTPLERLRKYERFARFVVKYRGAANRADSA